MSHFRLFLLSLTTVLTVSAMPAVQASADSCSGGTEKVFCNTEPAALNGQSVAGTGGLVLIASIIGGATAKFDCISNDFNGELEKLGAFKGTLLMLKCEEQLPVGCHLTPADEKEIEAKFTGQMESLKLALLTGSKEAGEVVTKLNILNALPCTNVGVFTLAGRQKVELPRGTEGRLEQEFVAKKNGSSLTLSGQTATLSFTTKAALIGAFHGTEWLVVDGV